jgi:CTP:phosphocholine cytidylyltransferase-like protein
MTVSDAPNCGITYNHHYDNRNSFIIRATEVVELGVNDILDSTNCLLKNMFVKPFSQISVSKKNTFE